MSSLMDNLGTLAGLSAYVVVGLLAALEAAAFVGLFVPGEFAMLVGGYIAYQDKAELIPMMAIATVGAILGDSLGYELGRRLGSSLRRGRLGRRVGEERWERAEEYLRTHGGRAVFFGRFIGVLRALVPALAGASHMRYRRFLFWNALGGLLWAPSLVYLGYLAGGSYRRVERYAGAAGLVILVLVVMVGAILALGRWVAHHPERFRALVGVVIDRPVVVRVRSRYRGQLEFLARRLKPGRALGLALTLQLAALGLAGWAFGSVVQDVLAGQGAAAVDGRITRSLVDHRVDWLTDLLNALTALGGGAVLVPAVVASGLLARRITKSWMPMLILGTALFGAGTLDDVVKPLVGRPRPDIGPLVAGGVGSAFPSGHAAQSVAVYGALAYLAAGWTRSWTMKVAAWTAALVLALLVGFSRVYLGVHWTTDVLGGWALGAVWLACVLVSTSVLRGAWHRIRPPEGEEGDEGPRDVTEPAEARPA